MTRGGGQTETGSCHQFSEQQCVRMDNSLFGSLLQPSQSAGSTEPRPELF